MNHSYIARRIMGFVLLRLCCASGLPSFTFFSRRTNADGPDRRRRSSIAQHPQLLEAESIAVRRMFLLLLGCSKFSSARSSGGDSLYGFRLAKPPFSEVQSRFLNADPIFS